MILSRLLFFVFCIFYLLNVPLSAEEKGGRHGEKEKTVIKQPHQSDEESSLLYFPLKTKIDTDTLIKIQAPTQTIASIPVTLWVGGIDRLAFGAAFLSTLPAHIGILINPFEALPADVLSLISKQNRQWALVIPTRNRFDGEERSPATLNNTKESHEYFEQIIIKTKIKTVFIPDMIDVDQEVLDFIVMLAKKYGLTLIIPPQFFENIQELCRKQGVPYQLLNAFTANNVTFDDFKEILDESVQSMKAFGELRAAVLLTDEAKKSYFNEYIQLIQANHGLFVDEKPLIQAK